MKKGLRRMMALLLALCMLSSAVPPVVIAEEAGSSNQTSGDGSQSVVDTGVKLVYNYKAGFSHGQQVREVTYADTHNFWEYAADKTTDAGRPLTINTKYGIQAGFNKAGYWFAVKIHVPVADEYDVKMDYAQGPYGGIGGVYIIPLIEGVDAITEALTEENRISTVDFYNTQNTSVQTADLGNVTIKEPGDYLVAYKCEKKSTGGSNLNMLIGALTLTSGDGAALMSMDASIDREELKVGNKAQINATAYLSDRSTTGVEYTYTAQTPELATVNSEGVITALAEGEAKFTVTATCGYYTKEVQLTLPVTPLNLSGATVIYDWMDGFEYKDDVRSITYADTNNFWAYHSDTNSSRTIQIHTWYGIQTMFKRANEWLAVKIRVPAAGDYVATMEAGTGTSGCYGVVYILPGDTQSISTALANANVLAAVDYYGDPQGINNISLGTLSFDAAGEYLMVYKTIQKNENVSGDYFQQYIGALTLDGGAGAAIMDMTAAVDKNEIKIGNKAQIYASAHLSNLETNGVTYTYTSLNPEIAEVDANGTVKGLAEGDVQIKVVATLGEESVEKTVDLKILPLNTSGITLEYKLTKGFAYKDPIRDITYDQTGNFWAYHSDTNSGRILQVHTVLGLQMQYRRLNEWMAIKINVPAAGDYSMNLEHGKGPNGCIGDVYILPGDTASIKEALGSAVSLGKVNYYNAEGQVVDNTDFGTVTFSTAGEYLVVFHASQWSYDGASNAEMYAKSITLDGGDGAALMDLTASVSKSELKVGSKTQISAVPCLSYTGATGAVIEYTSLTPETAAVDANGYVTGLAAGEARIKVTATLDGAAIEKTVVLQILELNLSGTTVVYNYKSGYAYQDPVRDITYDATHNFWAYHSDNAGARTLQIHTYYGIQAMFNKLGQWFAVKINVPVAGDYNATMEYGKSGSGCVSQMYILPGDTQDIAAAIADAVPVVSVDHYDTETHKTPFSTELGVLSFETAGEYIIVYKAASASPNGGSSEYVQVGKLTLDGGDGVTVMDMTASVDRPNLKVGDTAKITAKLYWSDPAATGETYRYESLNPKVATVDADGNVKAVGVGEATIKITATKDGVSSERTVSVKVNELKASGVSLIYNFKRGFAYKDPVRDITFEDTNNFWAYHSDTAPTKTIQIHSKNGIQAMFAKLTDYLAVMINVPVAGDYAVSLEHVTTKYGCIGDVYILPGDTADIPAALQQTLPVGTVDYYGKDETQKTVEFNSFTFETAGQYLVVFKGKAASGGTYEYQQPMTLILNGGDGKVLMDMKIESSELDLTQGEYTKLTSTAYLSDSTVADAKYTYTSLTPDVAIVDAEGNVLAMKGGEAQIKVTAKTASGDQIEKIFVQQVKSLKQSGAAYTYDFEGTFAHDTDVRGITYAQTGDSWEFLADDSNGKRIRIHSSYGIQAMIGATKFVALKIKVPKAGDYLVNLEHALLSSSGTGSVYIIPGVPKDVASIKAAMTDETFAGEVNYYKTGAMEIVNTELGIINFPNAGEYTVVFKSLTKGNQTAYLGLTKLHLNGINDLKRVYVEKDSFSLNYKQTAQITASARKLDGSMLKASQYTVTYLSSDPETASVDKNGLITATGHGVATITVTATDGSGTAFATVTVNCTDNTGIKDSKIELPAHMYVRQSKELALRLFMNSGNEIVLKGDDLKVTFDKAGILTYENGLLTGAAAGTVQVTVATTFVGQTVSKTATVLVELDEGKTGSSYYTEERMANALENVSKYEWASKTAKTKTRNAAQYVNNVDVWYNAIIPESIARNRQNGFKSDSNYNLCPYCGQNVVGTYGGNGVGGWIIDPVEHPWKIKCPFDNCSRLFPSNDFESFYKLGLDENGVFDIDKAYKENDILIAKGEKGYLVNELYNFKDESWGVDDGYGYRVYSDGCSTGHNVNGCTKDHRYTEGDSTLDQDASFTPINLYMYQFWQRMSDIMATLKDAYVYSGDAKYARTGLILLDRIADVMPGYDISVNSNKTDFILTDGGSGHGLFKGSIQDCTTLYNFAMAADAFFPHVKDPELVSYLSAKAKELGLDNDKSSGEKIWENIDQNILLETWEAAKSGKIKGNYGMQHQAVAAAALAHDCEPETSAMLEWIYAPEPNYASKKEGFVGGNISGHLIDVIDRDGMGNEISPSYNSSWIKRLHSVAKIIAVYDPDSEYNFFLHPKYVQMYMPYTSLVLSDNHLAQIGDSGSLAGLEYVVDNSMYIEAYELLKDTVVGDDIARFIYKTATSNGAELKDLHYDVFTKDPEKLQDEVMAVVQSDSSEKSEMLPGYGYSVLRDGVTGVTDTLRSVWMFWGFSNAAHAHYDSLTIGIEAFGLNFAPDLAYPINTGGDTNRAQWVSATVSHNTVVINEKNQNRLDKTATPYVFDDSGYVKVMGVDSEEAYDEAEIYRRTMVQIRVDDKNSYYVDFFRVLGGSQHTYSFHASSHRATAAEGLNLVEQVDSSGSPVGTYAGADVPFGNDPGTGVALQYPRGYTWMKNVRKDTNLGSNSFAVDFRITDYRGAIENSDDLFLRMTQINNFVPDEVAIVGGDVPDKKDNAAITDKTETLEYVLTQRKAKDGQELDSLFTTVFEPYRQERYITSIEAVPVTLVAGEPGAQDTAMALKLTHVSGRVDYVFYASNNTVTYRVADLFDVCGYIGVYSLNEKTGDILFRYVADGSIIGTQTNEPGRYTGSVLDFSKELTLDGNYIDVDLDPAIAEKLVGRYIHITNDGVENAVYHIKSAEAIDGGVRLNIGTVSLIRAHRDKANLDAGYIYNVSKGQSFVIPMSFLGANFSMDASLASLKVTGGAVMDPQFDTNVVHYKLYAPSEVRTVSIEAVATDPNATVTVEFKGVTYENGTMTDAVLSAGMTDTIVVTVIAEDGITSQSYQLVTDRYSQIPGGDTTQQPGDDGSDDGSDTQNFPWGWVIASAVLFVVGGAGVILFLIIKKRSKKS